MEDIDVMEKEILKAIYDGIEKGESVALATIIDGSGSIPRRSGTIMAVWQDGKILGSVGGGLVEHKVITKSIECIEQGVNTDFEYKLNEKGDLDAHCGGEFKGFIKVFKPRQKLIIVGAGHVGENVFKLAKILDFYTIIVDDREEFASEERFHGADEILAGDIEKSLSKCNIDSETYIVLVSKGHATDAEALRAVVSRGAAYIGMIGSRRKNLYVMNKLIGEGIEKQELQKVYAPIGLNICSETPAEIAFAILSEILVVKNKGSLGHFKDLKKIPL